jgi:DNA replication protein DnaD
MLAKKDFLRMFSPNEIEKLKIMSVDEFPTASEVVQ